jgi:adenosylmethionine-8-amino-7-oxononanoate aminotransferase
LAEFDQFLATHAQHIAAMIIEPLVQGAGGMKMHSAETLSAITQRCQQHGIVVIYDEIFTGFGRTGSLFAFEQTTVVPDIICLSKALTGGTLPLSATIASTTIFEAFLSESLDKALRHGFTFMGNALACSAANAGLDLFEQEPRLAQVRDIESILNQTLMPLKAIAGVKDVRVKGAIGAVQLEQLSIAELNWFKARSIADGVWLRPLMDVIYTTPPFTIETPDLLEITRSMQSQVKDWSEQFRIVSKA